MRAMARILHVVCAVLGLAGAYLWGFAFFTDGSTALIHWSEAATLVGLAGLTGSGARLFLKDPTRQLASGKFLSNMTVMGVLVVIEIASLAWPLPQLRVASLVSWTWIFAAAVLNPPYRYYTFVCAYAAVLALALGIFAPLW